MLIKQKKDYIDYLKAFAIIFVVVGHSMIYHNEIKKDMLYRGVYLLISSVQLPMFFFVAGYLCRKQEIKGYYLKKIYRIIVPFIFFTSLKLIWSFFVSNEFAHASSYKEQIYRAFINGELYWFIYAIFIMYCVAPFLWEEEVKKDYKYRNVFLFILVVIINILLSFMQIDVTRIGIFQIGKAIIYFPYFLAGIICNQNSMHNMMHNIMKNKKILCCATTIIIVLTFVDLNYELSNNYLFRIILSFALMYVFYSLAKTLPKKVYILKLIGRYSLQIMFFDSFFKVYYLWWQINLYRCLCCGR